MASGELKFPVSWTPVKTTSDYWGEKKIAKRQIREKCYNHVYYFRAIPDQVVAAVT